MKTTHQLIISSALLIGSAFLLQSCKTIPKGVTAVSPFSAERYLGKWYEIARLDFRFEKNMNNTTANYSFNPDNSIKVDNRGYNYKKQKWEQAIGKAKFVKNSNTGMLKVSFFGPFYSGYNVIELDKDYKYALIIGKSTDYMWLLSREKTMPKEIMEKYLKTAKNAGVNVEKLVWVEHNK